MQIFHMQEQIDLSDNLGGGGEVMLAIDRLTKLLVSLYIWFLGRIATVIQAVRKLSDWVVYLLFA